MDTVTVVNRLEKVFGDSTIPQTDWELWIPQLLVQRSPLVTLSAQKFSQGYLTALEIHGSDPLTRVLDSL